MVCAGVLCGRLQLQFRRRVLAGQKYLEFRVMEAIALLSVGNSRCNLHAEPSKLMANQSQPS